MLVPILLFIVGLVCLIKGGDWFVDGAVGVAEKFRVPDIIIGATVVSIGTTLPEVMVSSTSAFGGHGEIAYGNAIGSVICNTALIAALTIAIRPSEIEKKSLRKPVISFFLAAAIYAAVAYTTGYFNRVVGVILLAIFVVYMVLTVKEGFAGGEDIAESGTIEGNVEPTEEEAVAEELEAAADSAEVKEEGNTFGKNLLLLIVGAAVIAVGADLLVDNGTLIAEGFGVPESVIALTFVALGTSLPELVTAITSLAKGHSALSLGNICGANLFNLVLVSGMACTIGPYTIPVEKTITIGQSVMNASLIIDMPLMIFVMAILTLPALKTGKLNRWVGILLLICYAGFCAFQFLG